MDDQNPGTAAGPEDPLMRTRLLYGDKEVEKLLSSRVAVFGLGGVGGYVVEALSRSGIGKLDLIDSDRIEASNINRQILATFDSLGERKVDAAYKRVKSINPDCEIRTFPIFFRPETKSEFDFLNYDYVVDAIDTVSGKLSIVECCLEAGVPVISCMGTGNKIHPEQFRVADIYETSVCPLAKVMRRELKKRGIEKLKVVYSKEVPLKQDKQLSENGRHIPASAASCPAAAGIIVAAEVVNDLTK